jgi:LPXTG-motif cell wall-anchored protein
MSRGDIMNRRFLGRLAATTIGASALALAISGPAFAQIVPGPGPAMDSISVTPGTVAPGGTVTVHVTCTGAGNDTISVEFNRQPGAAQADSPTISVQLSGGSGSGSYTVPAGASPGSDTAIAYCPNGSPSSTFTISPAGAPRGGTGLEDDGSVLALAGAGALAAAGAAGGFLLMRRRVDAPVA